MRFIGWVVAAALLIVSQTAGAEEYPDKSRTLRIVVSYPPGAANDILARLVGQKLQERWGVAVVVDNRAGANGMIGASAVAKAAPDGYTLWLGTDGPAAINLSLYHAIPYDPVKDFAPLTLLARYQLVLVVPPSLGVKTVSEFIALAKKNPGSLSYGSPGTGSQHHLGMEWLAAATGIEMLHVPYKGSAAAVTGMLTGDVQAQLQGTAVVQPFLTEGRMIGLAVSSANRSPVVPEIPTMIESGVPGYDIGVWFGLLAPAGTPAAIVNKLHDELAEIIQLPDIREKMLVQGLEPTSNTPEEFAALIKSEIVRWGKIVATAKVKPIN
ncbi:MAG: hypothetical protein QOJ15_12077 [Bradyrhizobium sp.]|nr:hypothetical protein [Bradyrhizobium sp.]